MTARCAAERATRRLDDRGAAAGFEKCHPLVPANLVLDSDAVVELDEIGAAAQQNVLAVVDDFARAGMLIGGRPAAKIGPPLEQSDTKTAFRQRGSGGQPRQARPL